MSPLTRLLSVAALAFILKASAGPSLVSSSAPPSLSKPQAATLKASTKPPGTAGTWASDPMYAAALGTTTLATSTTFDPVDVSYASPVPEEPTALMLFAALGVLTVMLWKRRAPAHD